MLTFIVVTLIILGSVVIVGAIIRALGGQPEDPWTNVETPRQSRSRKYTPPTSSNYSGYVPPTLYDYNNGNSGGAVNYINWGSD